MKSGRGILVILFVLLCFSSLLFVWSLASIPRQVEQRFGPASSSLSTGQRLSYGAQLLLYEKSLLTPVSSDAQTYSFQVQTGESASLVALRLQEEGFIRDADAFRVYLVYAGLDTGLQAGSHQISPSQTAVEIAREIQDATPDQVIVGILPGWRAEEIAAALQYSGLSISREAFLTMVYQPADTTLPEAWRGYGSLEGFLMPGEYLFYRDVTPQDFVLTLLNRFDEQVTDDLRNAFDSRGLSLQDAVILASIIEREAMIDQEKPMIASVFFNRLEVGMRLESDPTVQYAVGYNMEQKTWWTNPLSQSDLMFDSPYNTYLYPGLPPGPIANPGISALQAVAYPATTPYYYFRAKCDQSGEHNFAVTYDEHLSNGCP